MAVSGWQDEGDFGHVSLELLKYYSHFESGIDEWATNIDGKTVRGFYDKSRRYGVINSIHAFLILAYNVPE